jgi:glycosyltransferase involved in cell wall biosynthesis
MSVLLPHGSKRRNIAKKFLTKTGVVGRKANAYQYWVDNIFPTLESLPRELLTNDPTPLISIVVPSYNPELNIFRLLVDSVINQTYQNWELIIVDASNEDAIKDAVKASSRLDDRIRIAAIENKGIAANTNQAIDMSKGDYIAFLDHDDTLAPHALQTMVSHIASNPKAKLYYSDEDKVSHDNAKYSDPHFKPAFSPDLLNNVNYITHFVVVEKDLIKQIKGLRPECDGAQDFDLLLRAIDHGASPHHVQGVLYHWRKTKNSTAENFSNKQNILDAGVKAVQEHLANSQSLGKVSPIPNRPGFYKVSYRHIKKEADIALVFPGYNDSRESCVMLTMLMHNTNLDDVAEIVVPNIEHVPKQYASSVKVVETKSEPGLNKEFLNALIDKTNSKKYMFIQDSLASHDQNWLHEMSCLLEEEHIFSAAPRIIKEGFRITDMGLIKDQNGSWQYLFQGLQVSENTLFGQTEWVRNVSALSGKAFAIKKSYIEKFVKDNSIDDKYIFNPTFFEQAATLGLYNTVWSHIDLQKIWYPASEVDGDPFFNSGLYQQNGKIYPYGVTL